MSAFAQTYEFTTLAGNAGYQSADGVGSQARFNRPTAVVVGASGNIYVADSGNHTIRKITPAGVVTTLAGRAGYAVSEDGSGNLVSLDGTGSYARFATGPGAIALDAAGNLFTVVGGPLSDSFIRKITPAGIVTTVAGTTGSFVSKGPNGWPVFTGPAILAIDANGSLVFADVTGEHINFLSRGWRVEYRGSVVRRIEADGTITAVAGSPDGVGSTDGIGSAARFMDLAGVTIDSAGNIYVSDRSNAAIRKIGAGGVVTTLAGAFQFSVRAGAVRRWQCFRRRHRQLHDSQNRAGWRGHNDCGQSRQPCQRRRLRQHRPIRFRVCGGRGRQRQRLRGRRRV
ncbi:MAG: hypothetical protein HY736_09585 [Verrucomicrobia bacterium]|nr:hypothetical protein [Verrucomicrobiota bacterium]